MRERFWNQENNWCFAEHRFSWWRKAIAVLIVQVFFIEVAIAGVATCGELEIEDWKLKMGKFHSCTCGDVVISNFRFRISDYVSSGSSSLALPSLLQEAGLVDDAVYITFQESVEVIRALWSSDKPVEVFGTTFTMYDKPGFMRLGKAKLGDRSIYVPRPELTPEEQEVLEFLGEGGEPYQLDIFREQHIRPRFVALLLEDLIHAETVMRKITTWTIIRKLLNIPDLTSIEAPRPPAPMHMAMARYAHWELPLSPPLTRSEQRRRFRQMLAERLKPCLSEMEPQKRAALKEMVFSRSIGEDLSSEVMCEEDVALMQVLGLGFFDGTLPYVRTADFKNTAALVERVIDTMLATIDDEADAQADVSEAAAGLNIQLDDQARRILLRPSYDRAALEGIRSALRLTNAVQAIETARFGTRKRPRFFGCTWEFVPTVALGTTAHAHRAAYELNIRLTDGELEVLRSLPGGNRLAAAFKGDTRLCWIRFQLQMINGRRTAVVTNMQRGPRGMTWRKFSRPVKHHYEHEYVLLLGLLILEDFAGLDVDDIVIPSTEGMLRLYPGLRLLGRHRLMGVYDAVADLGNYSPRSYPFRVEGVPLEQCWGKVRTTPALFDVAAQHGLLPFYQQDVLCEACAPGDYRELSEQL